MIDSDDRFSSANYELRKNFSIKIPILEKRLIFNTSLLSLKPIIYNLTDLKSCYNRKLPNIGGIVEELVGRNR